MIPTSRHNLPAEPLRSTALHQHVDGLIKECLATVETEPESVLLALLKLDAELDKRFADGEHAILSNALWWSEDDQRFCEWSAQCFANIGEMCSKLAETFLAAPVCPLAPEHLHELLDTALVNLGHAAKWNYIAGKHNPGRDYRRLHLLYLGATRQGYADRQHEIARAGGVIQTTTMALYLRAMLLDSFSTGNLTRSQIAILDCWLWTWINAYEIASSLSEGEAGFSIDLSSNSGLKPGFAGAKAQQGVFVNIEALRMQLAKVIKEFHSGRIYPGSGPATEFRIEDHVAVLDYLERFLSASKQGIAVRRAARSGAASQPIEGFLGLDEVFTRALGVRDHNPGVVMATLQKSAAAGNPGSDLERTRHVDFSQEYELKRRVFELHDVSDTGLGLEATEESASPLTVGDILGLRVPGTQEVTIGEIARKVPVGDGSNVHVGIRVLTANPTMVSMRSTRDKAGAQFKGIYIPGSDNSGRNDIMLLRDINFSIKHRYEIGFQREMFVIQFNRVRDQGRGWVAAGYDLLEVKKTHGNGEASPDAQFA
jgi:hypothetical protein